MSPCVFLCVSLCFLCLCHLLTLSPVSCEYLLLPTWVCVCLADWFGVADGLPTGLLSGVPSRLPKARASLHWSGSLWVTSLSVPVPILRLLCGVVMFQDLLITPSCTLAFLVSPPPLPQHTAVCVFFRKRIEPSHSDALSHPCTFGFGFSELFLYSPSFGY